jgi:hypothetical protein
MKPHDGGFCGPGKQEMKEERKSIPMAKEPLQILRQATGFAPRHRENRPDL